jgi:DNA-binding transcriptional ArsR family regulator
MAGSVAARFFQALGEPTRLALIEELRAGERNVNDLVRALGCPQPKVSRHLKVLKDAGIVRDEREGRHVAYALATERNWPREVRVWLDRLAAGVPLRSARVGTPADTPVPVEPPRRSQAPPPPRAPAARAARPVSRNLDPHLL